jgi:hypothetical protein
MEREEKLRQLLAPMIMTVGLIMFAMVSGVAAFLAVSVALGGPPDFGNIANQPLGP